MIYITFSTGRSSNEDSRKSISIRWPGQFMNYKHHTPIVPRQNKCMEGVSTRCVVRCRIAHYRPLQPVDKARMQTMAVGAIASKLKATDITSSYNSIMALLPELLNPPALSPDKSMAHLKFALVKASRSVCRTALRPSRLHR